MTVAAPQDKGLRGVHVLAMFVTGFGIVIAVNLTLAFNAVATFPGIETENSYVASQRFDAARAAQEALGWQVRADASQGRLALAFDGPEGPVTPAEIEARIGRATYAGEDLVLAFAPAGDLLVAKAALAPGAWVLHLDAVAADGTAFRKRLDIRVRP